ncbi:YbcC family protein [Bacillus carboniphilus]|uniref:Probable inorganic carbon transporter subunit DabA n=1 Tax=Bacillus carboniphilus TaxID=86663 RepID=A0ABN0WV03_9BACI
MGATSVLMKENVRKKNTGIEFQENDINVLIEIASRVIAPLWPISTFAARHPWMGLERQSFDQVAAWLKETHDVDIYPSVSMILSAKEKGEIDEAFVKLGLQQWLDSHSFTISRCVLERFCHRALKLEPLPNSLLSSQQLEELVDEYCERNASSSEHRPTQPVSFRIRNQHGERLVNILDYHVIKWCKLYLDESQAGWSMPNRKEGFYSAWRRLVQYDPALSKKQRDRLKGLPNEANKALQEVLFALKVPISEVQTYLEGHLLSLPGWAGMMLWRSKQSSHEQALLTEYLAVRISMEWALVQPYLPLTNQQSENKIATASLIASWLHWVGLTTEEWSQLSSVKQNEYVMFARSFDEKLCKKIWLEAWEQTQLDRLRRQISSNKCKTKDKKTSLAQFAFCIDVRSEPFRRQLEKEGSFETIGIAGFFGLPIATSRLGSDLSHPSLPVILKPQNTVKEETGQKELQSYLERKQAVHSISNTFKTMKQNVLSSLLLPELSGPWLSLQMVLRSFMPRRTGHLIRNLRESWLRKPNTTLSLHHVHNQEESLPIGFSEEEKVNYARNSLRMMGLLKDFSPLVVFCGHGSQSTNNPYASSLDCGACGGASGGFNARVLATLCNLPEVRQALSSEGITIPENTVFVAAEHNTTVDELHWIYVPDLSDDAQKAFNRIEAILPRVSQNANKKRLAQLAHLQKKLKNPNAVAHEFAEDWSEVRPEWGLARNAAFIIGQRELTQNCDLEGRVFLHNYDWKQDESGDLLASIIAGPGTVTQWINLQYYASTVAPHYYGSGNKVTQTVTAGLGVMQGNASDLLAGLPWQSVMLSDYEAFHSPLRLLIVIQAPKDYVEQLLKNDSIFREKVQNGWVRLASIDSEGRWETW